MRDGFRRIVILAEGHLSPLGSKTANCVIRFAPQNVVAVLDSTNGGRRVADILGYGGDIPVVASIDEGLRYEPDALLIGIAPPGGGIEPSWRPLIAKAINADLNVASGLHVFLDEDPEFKGFARSRGIKLWDLRRPPDNIPLTAGGRNRVQATIVLVSGSDCDVGKMTTSFLLASGLEEKGIRAVVAPTGQTSIFLKGHGIPLDRIISDFITGATELLIAETNEKFEPEVILVEGQGTLLHPVYGAVAMGILQGARPDAIVMCHEPGRQRYLHFEDKIPDIKDIVGIHEKLSGYLKPARVIGLSLCAPESASGIAPETALDLECRLNLPAEDLVTQGTSKLTGAIMEAMKGRHSHAFRKE
ncbi:DUF1611 domain-containing protein [Acidobacteriota bacterium]